MFAVRIWDGRGELTADETALAAVREWARRAVALPDAIGPRQPERDTFHAAGYRKAACEVLAILEASRHSEAPP